MAGIGGLVGGGIGEIAGKGALFGSQIAGDVARGALSSAITQGIDVATGLQDKFSWAGVAAAGVGAGVMGMVSREVSKGRYAGRGGETVGTGDSAVTYGRGDWIQTAGPSFGGQALAGGAALIANAATRSVIEGSNFGDNIMAALPDTIGSIVGNALGRAGAKVLEKAKARDLYNDAIDDPAVQASLQTPEARAALLEVGYKPGDRIEPKQLAAYLSRGAKGLSADGTIDKIKGNIADFISQVGAASPQRDIASVALKWNSALIASYSAIGLSMPGFQWTMIGAFVAKQVREQIINIDAFADAGKLASGGLATGALSRMTGDYLISNIIAGQIKVVSDVGSLALAYNELGRRILEASTVSNDRYAKAGFTYQIAAETAFRNGDPVAWASNGTNAAIQFGIREQRGLQQMWDNSLLNYTAKYINYLGLMDTTIHTPIGPIFAPRSGMDVTKLDDRIEIAKNAFIYMNRNLYAGPNASQVKQNWGAIGSALRQQADERTLPHPLLPFK